MASYAEGPARRVGRRRRAAVDGYTKEPRHWLDDVERWTSTHQPVQPAQLYGRRKGTDKLVLSAADGTPNRQLYRGATGVGKRRLDDGRNTGEIHCGGVEQNDQRNRLHLDGRGTWMAGRQGPPSSWRTTQWHCDFGIRRLGQTGPSRAGMGRRARIVG